MRRREQRAEIDGVSHLIALPSEVKGDRQDDVLTTHPLGLLDLAAHHLTGYAHVELPALIDDPS